MARRNVRPTETTKVRRLRRTFPTFWAKAVCFYKRKTILGQYNAILTHYAGKKKEQNYWDKNLTYFYSLCVFSRKQR